MAIRFKVHNGTTGDGDSLCDGCINSQVTEGYSQAHKVVYCNAPINGLYITWPVCKCNEYKAKETTALKEMEKVAWIVQPRKRGKVGFVQILSPGEARQAKEDKETKYGDPSELHDSNG